MTPEISVLTPSYAYGRFIGDAVESVLGQQGVAVEHIVQDSTSPDETVDVLRSYGSRVVWCSEKDAGQSDALNRALSRASGEWIAWLNADEFYLPGALLGLLSHARRTGADVVYGEPVLVDEDARHTRLVAHHRFYRRVLETYGPYISSCTVLIRRDLLGDEPWHASMRRVMDWDLYLTLAGAGARFAHLEQPVAAFRIHPEQATAVRGARDLIDYQLVRERHAIRVGSRLLIAVGRLLHAALKVQNGAYRREAAARRYRGRDLRWWHRCTEARAVAHALVARCSRRPIEAPR